MHRRLAANLLGGHLKPRALRCVCCSGLQHKWRAVCRACSHSPQGAPAPNPALSPTPAASVQVESFAQGLQQHQLATLPDGSTVLERSVTEHNLEAASKL